MGEFRPAMAGQVKIPGSAVLHRASAHTPSATCHMREPASGPDGTRDCRHAYRYFRVRGDRVGGLAGDGSSEQLQHVLDGVKSLELSRTKQAEQDGVSLGPLQRAVLLADFARVLRRCASVARHGCCTG